MLKKISGSKTVLVKINNLGKNNLPFIEDLKDKQIKYIDVVAVTSLPYISANCISNFDTAYLTLADKTGNKFPYLNIPLLQYMTVYNQGVKPFIGSVISLQNSYVTVTDSSDLGKYVVLVFWYDNVSYSQRNTTLDLSIDAFEVPIISATMKNQLPDNRTMVGKRFRRLFSSFPDVTASFKTGITYTDSKDLYLSLYKGNYAVIDTLPICLLYDQFLYEKLELSNIIFDFTNSFILVGGNGSGSSLIGKTVFLNAEYENK